MALTPDVECVLNFAFSECFSGRQALPALVEVNLSLCCRTGVLIGVATGSPCRIALLGLLKIAE